MASQATPDGHFSSVLGMHLSGWSKAENWHVGCWDRLTSAFQP